jgi:chloramphenicol-sensitive protein RarD
VIPLSGDAARRDRTTAAIAGVGAYLMWGFFAPFFKILIDRGVPSMTLLAHRIIWTMVFCALMLALSGRLGDMRTLAKNRAMLRVLAFTSVMIAINWVTFIYAVETHQLSQCALGYYMNPLVSVLLGLVVLGERLGRVQWFCLLLATCGVVLIVLARGQLPWIGLTVAVSFGLYGLMRKMRPVNPLTGLAVETAMLTPLAIAYASWAAVSMPTHFSTSTYGLLMTAGVLTSIPLLLFARAARTLKLSTMGFLQYIAPTVQLSIAVYNGEPFKPGELAGFIPIWGALLIFSTYTALKARHTSDSHPSGSASSALPNQSNPGVVSLADHAKV